MAPFYQITVCRSDGLTEYTINGQTVQNCPRDIVKPADADDPTKAVDYYEQVQRDQDDPSKDKDLQWRQKLGEKLMKLVGGETQLGMCDFCR